MGVGRQEETACKDLEESLQTDDKQSIEAKIQTLSEASASLAQKMYAEQAQGAEGEVTAEGSAGDDAVDAEFEEVKEDESVDEKEK